jgi:hypothetical protein
MKNLFKFLGIIALVAVVGFTVAACKSDDDSSGGGGGGGDDGGGGGGDGGGGGASFWKAADISSVYTASQDIISVTSSGSLFIATTDSGSGKIAQSADGVTWTVLHAGGALPGLGWSANKVAYANDMFFALNKKIAYSEDNGATWVEATGFNINTTDINGIISKAGYFISIGNSTLTPLNHSENGKDWYGPKIDYIMGDVSQFNIYSGVYASNVLVLAGQNGTMCSYLNPSYTAWNGATAVKLTKISSPFNAGTARDAIYGVAYNNTSGTTVAVGAKGKIAYSSTLISSWAAAVSPFDATTIVNDVAFGGGKFVAVGSGGKTATSTDGIAWTLETNSSTADIYKVVYGGGKFVAVGKGWIGYTE